MQDIQEERSVSTLLPLILSRGENAVFPENKTLHDIDTNIYHSYQSNDHIGTLFHYVQIN